MLTLQSSYLIEKEAAAVLETAGRIEEQVGTLSSSHPRLAVQFDMPLGALRTAVADLVAATERQSVIRDAKLRLDRELLLLDSAILPGQDTSALANPRQQFAVRQLIDLLAAARRTDNLFHLGELDREYHAVRRLVSVTMPGQLSALTSDGEGPARIFELRRMEFAFLAKARNALSRIREQTENINQLSATVIAQADVKLYAVRLDTRSSIDYAKVVILAVGAISAGVTIAAALFVVRYVAANLRAISEAMVRLALGDRSSRLARTRQPDDEIGKLFHAFRMFRATVLRLDRSNRQLRRKNLLFETVVAGMSDGVAITTPQGTIAAVSPNLPKVLRIEAGAVAVNRTLSGVFEASPFTSTGIRHDAAPENHELKSADGGVIECRLASLPDGGVVWLFSDVTERRRVEARLNEIRRIESLGKIAGEVAHDFGNILSTLSGNLHLIETARPDAAAKLCQRMGASVELGATLVQRLLAFARKQHLEPEIIDLNLLVSGMGDLVEIALNGEVDLVISPHGQPLLAKMDPGQLESAILNLCLNARQAMDERGRIGITLRARGDQAAEIEITDTGCGMAPDIRRQCLEPFFTARRDGQGTGLGLSMVYGFIRQSGGDLSIESEPGRGTTVTLVIPLATATDGPSIGYTDRRRCLLVDDDPMALTNGERMLTAAGFNVVVANSKSSAEGQLRSLSPLHVLVTDLHLDGLPSGWDLASKWLDSSAQARAVVVSGRFPEINPLADRYPGRLICVGKPLTGSKLAALNL
ncbi:ATP-binding protein [Ensifer sp. ENS11]|uniref:ATP-binding protein n=1 Tax=Ensifer sp. ENS11 TaxID=2769291 RepID=UPI001782525C|nr:ATP-binding protein [Ensifer sp. ENS11]MBD9491975.1 PAS-domain containing protein [Ensifer sp. ENS11]